MAMGGSTKVFSGNGNCNNKGRSYATILLMAFGAAIFAIMLLQKFRERRIFNLLIKEKDLELFSLHVLVQNERDHMKELKKNVAELKEKVYSIRKEKMNIESHIVEMQSKISSLQDEQKTAESALGEKENEITTMRQKETSEDNAQVTNLTEVLEQKEAEIEELKLQLENHQRSVSTDQQFIATVNSTENRPVARDNIEADDGLHKKVLHDHIDTDKKTDEETEEIKIENVGVGVVEKNNRTTSNEETRDDQGKRTTESSENNETRTQGDGHQEISEALNEIDGHELQTPSTNLIERGRRRHGYLSNTRGKRWKTIAKTRKLEQNLEFQLKKRSEHGNRNRGSIRINKLVQNNEMVHNTAVMKSGLPSRTSGHQDSERNGITDEDGSKNRSTIENVNVQVKTEKKVPEEADDSSDRDVRKSEAHVEPGIKGEDGDREDNYKEETDVSEFN